MVQAKKTMIRKFKSQQELGESGVGGNLPGMHWKDKPKEVEMESRQFVINKRPNIIKKEKVVQLPQENEEIMFASKGDIMNETDIKTSEEIKDLRVMTPEEIREKGDRFAVSSAFVILKSGKEFSEGWKKLILDMPSLPIDLNKAEQEAQKFYNDLEAKKKNDRMEELISKELLSNKEVNIVNFENLYKDGTIAVGLTSSQFEPAIKQKYFNLPLVFEFSDQTPKKVVSEFRSFNGLKIE